MEDIPPGIDPGPDPQFNLGKLAIEFDVDVDPESLVAPGNINVSVTGSQGHHSEDIAGTVQYDPATKTVYFIAADGIGFSPAAGENLEYTVVVIGSGEDCVKRAGGECIDGCDRNSLPGDNHVKRFTVVG